MDRADRRAPLGHRHSWAQRVSYDVSRHVARLASVATLGIRVGGRRCVPPTGGGLVCANHQSFLDPIVVGLAFDRRLNFLARDTLFASPTFRWLIHWYDAIPIQREGLGLAGIKETLHRLRAGELVLIFPEGTRSPDGRLQPLRSGICVLARRGRVPLIPVAVEGTFQAWPRHRKWPGVARVAVQIGPPLEPDEYAALSDDQLTHELSRRMAACLQAARRSVGAAAHPSQPTAQSQ